MIKLIASDLDGTLLLPSKQLPESTFNLIDRLYENGILFCPASGRQLASIQQIFAPVQDKIAIIAENGGLVWYQGQIIYAKPTPAEQVKYALNILRKESDLYPLLSTTDKAYYENPYPPFVEMCQKSYPSLQQVDNLDDVVDKVTTLKISVWDPLISAEHGGKILPDKIKGLRTMVSGFDWLDVCVDGAHKGDALKNMLAYFHLSPEECMAFGDHLNDKEMLQVSGHPFVTANGFPLLKEQFSDHIIPSCAEEGVIQKLKELL